MKIAIGMIVRNLISAHPLTDFLDNAEKYDHPIERVIVVYSHEADPEAIQELQRRTRVSLIRLQSYERAHMILKQLGVRFSSIQQLLFCPLIDTHGLIPYGFNRNHVLMEALFTGVDYLIFVDSDVQPSVLHRTPDGEVGFEEVDFIGAHLYGMSLGATITSSDYSGYNILPPASFEGMTALLWGLHKEDMAEFWKSSKFHGGLVVKDPEISELQPTTKVLGGNMGIRMSALTTLPPFFSPYYFYNKTPLLARGEDTLMGLAASRSQIKCLDIQTPIFHDTYGDYPKIPNLKMTAVFGTGSTMPVRAGSAAMCFSAGRRDMRPRSFSREAGGCRMERKHCTAIQTTGASYIFRISSPQRKRGCRIW